MSMVDRFLIVVISILVLKIFYILSDYIRVFWWPKYFSENGPWYIHSVMDYKILNQNKSKPIDFRVQSLVVVVLENRHSTTSMRVRLSHPGLRLLSNTGGEPIHKWFELDRTSFTPENFWQCIHPLTSDRLMPRPAERPDGMVPHGINWEELQNFIHSAA